MEGNVKENILYTVAYLTEAMIEMEDLFYDDNVGNKISDIYDKIMELRNELLDMIPTPKTFTKEEKIQALRDTIKNSHEIEEVRIARKELQKVREGTDTFFNDEKVVKAEFHRMLIEQYLMKSRTKKVGWFIPADCNKKCPLLPKGEIILEAEDISDTEASRLYSKILKCSECGSDLKLNIGYTGADWDTVAGDGSGYGWAIHLDCTNDSCALIYPIGHVKNFSDFTKMKNENKCVL